MPDLSRVVGYFSSTLSLERGGTFKGFLKAPPNVRATFDGLFSPRSMLLVPVVTDVVAGDVVIDDQGNKFLCAHWADSRFGSHVVCRQFVLFEAPHTLAWTRATTTSDPLTGLQRRSGDTALGNVTSLKEAVARRSDAIDIAETLYRVMTGAAVLENDFLDGKRILRVEHTLGLSYVETL